MSQCGGLNNSGTRVLTIVELAHESDYPQRLPSLGYSAELSRPDAALVVVYDGASPTDLQIDAGSGRTHAPSPGTYDICVATLGLHQRFTNLEIDWAYLTGEAHATPPNIVAKLPDKFSTYGSNLVWDSARGLVWYAYVGCGESSTLYALDPRTSRTQNWTIPSNTFGNCDAPQVGLDSGGAVWIMENSLMVRFSPESGPVKSVRVAPELTQPSRTQPTASFPTAMAFDGDVALITRFNTPSLTRVTAEMALSTVPVPPQIAGASGLAVANGALFALTDAGVAVIALDQTSTASPQATATQPTVTVHGGPNPGLTLRPDGRVVRWTGLVSGVLLAQDGTPTGPAVMPAVPPFASRATRFVTDWTSRGWYVVGTTQPVIIQVG